jgi:hypothetical protein
MTDERKSATWQVCLTNEDYWAACDEVLNPKFNYGLLVHEISQINTEDEAFNLLELGFKKCLHKIPNVSRELFAEHIFHHIKANKLDIPNLVSSPITPQLIQWINRWVNPDSPIMKKALCNSKLRCYFEGNILILRECIQQCEKAETVAEIARLLVKFLPKIPSRGRKELREELNNIGFNIKYDTLKKALTNAEIEAKKEKKSARIKEAVNK